jgi:hypothetical protein
MTLPRLMKVLNSWNISPSPLIDGRSAIAMPLLDLQADDLAAAATPSNVERNRRASNGDREGIRGNCGKNRHP